MIKPQFADFGKMPPQVLEMEELLLGCLLLESDRYYEIIEFIDSESFYKDAHQKIFVSIEKLIQNEVRCDIALATEQLRKDNVLDEIGGPYYITTLTGRIASAANIQEYALHIRDCFIKRELIRVSTDICNKAYDTTEDTNEVVEFAETSIFNITNKSAGGKATHIKDILQECQEGILKAYESDEKIIGIPTGSQKLDRLTNGWQEPDLIIIAARPSMGKTAVMLFHVVAAALSGINVLIFSLEMSKKQLVNRLISKDSDVSPMVLSSGRFNENKLDDIDAAIKSLEILGIYIDDTAGISITDLKARSRKAKQKHDIGLICVDYLQLMAGSKNNKGNREGEVSEISRGLKMNSKNLEIPTIALSQLNRSVESRAGDKRPQLSDLRESGAIEQDADLVMFIHRPEKYGILEDENMESTEGMTELILSKHRNGSIGDIKIYNNECMTQFRDDKIESMNTFEDFTEPNRNFDMEGF